jgi:hypothetical protein
MLLKMNRMQISFLKIPDPTLIKFVFLIKNYGSGSKGLKKLWIRILQKKSFIRHDPDADLKKDHVLTNRGCSGRYGTCVRDSSFFLRRESLREESAPPTTTSPVSTLSRSLHAALSLLKGTVSRE